MVPPRVRREMEGVRMARALSAGVGFEVDGAFLFRADAHDEGEKEILGTTFPPGRGREEGEAVLDLVADHSATAEHVARKLAVRFVSDEPPAELVERLAAVFRRSGGNLRATVEALVRSPEFWAEGALGEKIKSPFELAVSALRALDAEITNPRETIEWIGRMGQPLYAYQAPTGYPDRADFWVNTGSLLHRMNYGLELAAGRIQGVRYDLEALNGRREPESLADALSTYAALLLPERDLTETLALLEPLAGETELSSRLAEAASSAPAPPSADMGELDLVADTDLPSEEDAVPAPPATPAHVIGVILGSPEFQRR